MELIHYGLIETQMLPGRTKKAAVGRDNCMIHSDAMNVFICRYSEESGVMEPHKHGEETIYVTTADRAYMRFGDSPDSLSGRIPLYAGLMAHFKKDEWHVFEYEKGGHLELICMYGSEV